MYENSRAKVIPLEEMEFPQADEKEEGYGRCCGAQFYKPSPSRPAATSGAPPPPYAQRYWKNTVEMQEYCNQV